MNDDTGIVRLLDPLPCAFASAAWFFSKNCIKHADKGSSRDAITAVTKSVNGGTIGLDDRIKHFEEYYKSLS